MVQRIYGLWDLKGQCIIGSALHVLPTDAVAARYFTDVMDAQGTLVNQHPQDFQMVCFGSLDQMDLPLNGAHLSALESGMSIVVTGSQVIEARSRTIPGRVMENGRGDVEEREHSKTGSLREGLDRALQGNSDIPDVNLFSQQVVSVPDKVSEVSK